jgi:predicted metal-dependent phosphoesterase TrpH
MNSIFRADLHCHSNCSDGALTPEELIQLASDQQLQGISITDHDTINAYTVAMPAAIHHKISLLSGVEFSAMHRQTSVHILAYGFSISSTLLHSFCQKHSQRRFNRNQLILDLLAKHGMVLTPEEFPTLFTYSSERSIGRPHIAQALVKKQYVPSIQQAFQLYLGEGKPCYALSEQISVEETIELIHTAKGLAILAHPHLIHSTILCKDLLGMNFDGLEGYYASFSTRQQERWLKIANRKGWIITGGSDFHGAHKLMNPLGASWVNENV